MMNLRTSWVNRFLLKNIIKNNLFPAKISLLIFTGFFILALILDDGAGIRQVCVAIFVISAIVLTTVYPGFIQSYLIDKTKVSVVKVIPLSTKCIWFTNYLAGYLIVLITLLIEGMGILFVDIFGSHYIIIDNHLFRFILMIFVLLFVYYTISFLVSSLAGNRMGQIIFSVVTYTLPGAFLMSFILFTNYLVPGSINNIENFYLNLVLPLTAGIEFISNGDKIIFIHTFISFILLALSYYVYKNRDDEYIGEPLVFHKIGVVLKVGIVLIVTIAIFYLILVFSRIDITFGYKGMLTLLLIYLLIGVIVAIFIEIIFKSKYVYRKLLIYVPILLIFFAVNYVIANNQYNRAVADIFSRSKVIGELYIYSYQNDYGHRINFDQNYLVDLVKYLNNNRDHLHYETIDDYSLIVNFSLFDSSGENYHENLINYKFDQKIFIDYFNHQGKDYLAKKSKNFEHDNYLFCYLDETTIYLNQEKTKQLHQMVEDQKIEAKDFFSKDMINLYGANGKNYAIKLNEQIRKFIMAPELIESSKFIEECDSYIHDSNLLSDLSDNNKIATFVKEELKLDNIKSFYENNIELSEFSDNYAIYLVDLTAVNEIDSYEISLEIRLESNNDQIIITSINGKAGK